MPILKTLARILVVVLLAAVMAPIAQAQPQEKSIGQVVAVRGEVTAVDGSGQSRRLAMKSPIYRQDTIKTGSSGRIQLLFADSTIVSLGQQSELNIAEYDWQPEKQDGTMKTKIKEGTFRIMGGAITKAAPQKFTTETPAATIGIRGSMYAGKVSGAQLSVVFQAGKGIDVVNDAGTVAITKPGFGTRVVSPASPPLPPVKFTAQDLAELNEGLQTDNSDQGADDSAPSQEQEETTENEQQSDDGQAAESGSSDDESSVEGENTEQTAEGEEVAGQDEAAATEDGGQAVAEESGMEAQAVEEGAAGTGEGTESAEAADSGMAAGDGVVAEETSSSEGSGVGSPAVQTISDETTPQETGGPLVLNEPALSDPAPSGETSLANPEVLVVASPTPVASDSLAQTTNQIISTASSTIQQAQTDDTQTQTVTETQTVLTNSLKDLSGRHLGVLIQWDGSGNGTDTGWFGPSAATLNTLDGSVTGRATALDGKVFPFAFSLPVPVAGAAYQGPHDLTATQTVNLLGVDRTFGINVATSNLGEFAIFRVPNGVFNNGAAEFHELGFVGIPSTAVPTDGIDLYFGGIGGLSSHSTLTPDDHPGISEKMEMEVNWRNRKVVGFMKDIMDLPPEFDVAPPDQTTATTNPDSPPGYGQGFFFGEVTPTGQFAVRIFSSSKGDMYPAWIKGTTTFGQFYGSAYQGFGMTATGGEYSIYNGAPQESWEVTGAGFRDPNQIPEDLTSPSGSSIWQGFAVGVSEDIQNPDNNRQVFLSDAPTDVSLTINRDAGTVQGTMSLDCPTCSPVYASIQDLDVGGPGSAYVLDDRFAALLGGAGDTPINGATGLKPDGNFLITAPPEEQFSDEHLTWGYWEITYAADEGGSTIHRHLHMPSSYWLAGRRKLDTEVANAIAANFTGRYVGGARGVGIDSAITTGPQMYELTHGQSQLDIYFGTGQVNGSLTFDQAAFQINSSSPGAVDSSGFWADMRTPDGTTYVGQVNGAYYGPAGTNQVEAVGGTFHGNNGGVEYLGIFGGDRVGPAP